MGTVKRCYAGTYKKLKNCFCPERGVIMTIPDIRIVDEIGEPNTYDGAVGEALVRTGELSREFGRDVRADILDLAVGKIVSTIEPSRSNASAGYTRAFSHAWDQMMERRDMRRIKGETTITDA